MDNIFNTYIYERLPRGTFGEPLLAFSGDFKESSSLLIKLVLGHTGTGLERSSLRKLGAKGYVEDTNNNKLFSFHVTPQGKQHITRHLKKLLTKDGRKEVRNRRAAQSGYPEFCLHSEIVLYGDLYYTVCKSLPINKRVGKIVIDNNYIVS